MSVDLAFWKYRNGIYSDHALVYQTACCDHGEAEGLEALPIDEILKETAAVFHEWSPLDSFSYERAGHGSFQISATPQSVRFDCYSMSQADMKRFSSMMARFGCPLYDPQQGVRFDKIALFLVDEAGKYAAQAEREFSRLLPRLELTSQTVSWDEYVRRSKALPHIQYAAAIHRAKTLTKVTSFMRFGSAWANRPCQCKTARLADKDDARRILEELLRQSIERVVNDFLERTCYE